MDPVPEVDLFFEKGKAFLHPVISVPSHGRTPIICIRNSEHTRHGAVYIRKPGPKSEEPSNISEWSPLLRRCLLTDSEDLASTFRAILAPPKATVEAGLDAFREPTATADERTEKFQHATQPEIGEDINKAESSRMQFLRRADSHRYRVYTTLFFARAIQVAIRERRLLKEGDKGVGNVNNRIDYMLNQLLQDGVELFVPPDNVAETAECLGTIKNLLELRQKVDSKEAEPPPQQEEQELFRRVEDGVRSVVAGAIWQGSQAILYQQEMMRTLKELRESLNIEP